MTGPIRTRRSFLRAAGGVLALPLFENVAPGASQAARQTTVMPPRRLVAVCSTLGIHSENLFPNQAGRDLQRTAYLDPLWDLRGGLTLISGTSHPGVDGGHASEAAFLTAAPHPGGASFRNTISLDQVALEGLAPNTRFGSLVLSTGGNSSLSFTRSGAMIPAENRPSRLFRQLFVDGTPAEIDRQLERLQEGRSILDDIHDTSRAVRDKLGVRDRERLDEYFSAVRDVEQRLQRAQAWARRPKPTVTMPEPRDVADDGDVIARTRLMFDLIHLALQTDSTRIISLKIYGHGIVPPIDGVNRNWHDLSHHGRSQEKLSQLRLIELAQFREFAQFLIKLRRSQEGTHSLLDRTSVLYGSNLGNASSHDTRNMPILLAGGGFRHGQHLAFDRNNNTPLCNLYVSLLQRLGLETSRFASGASTLSGLAFA